MERAKAKLVVAKNSSEKSVVKSKAKNAKEDIFNLADFSESGSESVSGFGSSGSSASITSEKKCNMPKKSESQVESEKMVIRVINEVKHFPTIWDKHCGSHKNLLVCEKIFRQIARELNCKCKSRSKVYIYIF